MKKSNLFLLVAAIILIVTLGIYNTTLKAEYLSGDYKDPLRNFKSLNLKNFNTVAVNAASEISVTIQQGQAFKVQVYKPDADNIDIKQDGDKLVINVNYLQDRRITEREKVIITLPVLQAVSTNAQYTLAGKQVTFGKIKNDWTATLTKIIGFTQDSLFIQQDNLNKIELINNKISFLQVISGNSAGSRSSIQVNRNNTIAQANFDIRNKSELTLENIFIPQLTYQFSDSAKVNFSGAALAILKNR